jgi:hypothetical protein
MTENPPGRGFLTSVPGILTAVAAVLTAAGGIYLGVQENDKAEAAKPAQPVVVNLSTSGDSAPTPAASANVDEADLRLDNAPTGSTDPADPDKPLVDQCAAGNAQACVELLDTLVGECGQGYGLSCDMLFFVSPEGSDYEEYGATCGGRFGWDYASACREL